MMMFLRRKLDNKKPIFRSVAIATLLSGATILALGLVELGFNLWHDGNFASPMSKVIGGLIVLSLGYIHLDLEMLRTK